MTLNELGRGQVAQIKSIYARKIVKQRLLDLGFVENEHIRCENISMFGDPKSYLINGIVVTLRNDDAKRIFVDFKRCDNE